jgi:hypothetical protein
MVRITLTGTEEKRVAESTKNPPANNAELRLNCTFTTKTRIERITILPICRLFAFFVIGTLTLVQRGIRDCSPV